LGLSLAFSDDLLFISFENFDFPTREFASLNQASDVLEMIIYMSPFATKGVNKILSYSLVI